MKLLKIGTHNVKNVTAHDWLNSFASLRKSTENGSLPMYSLNHQHGA